MATRAKEPFGLAGRGRVRVRIQSKIAAGQGDGRVIRAGPGKLRLIQCIVAYQKRHNLGDISIFATDQRNSLCYVLIFAQSEGGMARVALPVPRHDRRQTLQREGKVHDCLFAELRKGLAPVWPDGHRLGGLGIFLPFCTGGAYFCALPCAYRDCRQWRVGCDRHHRLRRDQPWIWNWFDSFHPRAPARHGCEHPGLRPPKYGHILHHLHAQRQLGDQRRFRVSRHG